MPSSRLENQVNVWRGYCTVLLTAGAFVPVLTVPQCLAFWDAQGRRHVGEPSGMVGFVLGVAFLAYLASTRRGSRTADSWLTP